MAASRTREVWFSEPPAGFVAPEPSAPIQPASAVSVAPPLSVREPAAGPAYGVSYDPAPSAVTYAAAPAPTQSGIPQSGLPQGGLPQGELRIPGTPPQTLGWLPVPGPQPGATQIQPPQPQAAYAPQPYAPPQQQPAYAAPAPAAYAPPAPAPWGAAPWPTEPVPAGGAIAGADTMFLPSHQAVCVARQIEAQLQQGGAQVALAFDQCRF